MTQAFKLLALVLVLVSSLLSSYAQSTQSTNQVDSSSSAPYCDSTLWPHVYHAYRLHVKNKCMTVTGIVTSKAYEADGDIHIRLKCDSAFAWMINDTNKTGEGGNLVCEPICATTVTQSDAIVPCKGLKNIVYIPGNGEHVSVTGPYCHDLDHGWNEMHPVTSISIIYHTNTNNPGIEKAPMVVFPNPADDMVNFRLTQKPSSPVFITIVDGIGRSAGHYQMMASDLLQITTTYLPNGIYYYNIAQNNSIYKSGRFVVVHNH